MSQRGGVKISHSSVDGLSPLPAPSGETVQGYCSDELLVEIPPMAFWRHRCDRGSATRRRRLSKSDPENDQCEHDTQHANNDSGVPRLLILLGR